MTEFKRTLPLPPPGPTWGEPIEDGRRQAGVRKEAARAEKSKATPRPAQLSSSSSRDFRRSKPGGPKKHVARPEPSDATTLSPSLDGVAAWVAKGRALSRAIDEAIRAGVASPKLQACIDRAYASWNLDGVPARQIARVAHLSRRAHEAIRSTNRPALETAYTDCARVLHAGLPSLVRKRVPIEIVVDVVRTMRREADGWAAVVESTMLLVGWTHCARARAADAIRAALEEALPESAREE
jgi:hypothetical protein